MRARVGRFLSTLQVVAVLAHALRIERLPYVSAVRYLFTVLLSSLFGLMTVLATSTTAGYLLLFRASDSLLFGFWFCDHRNGFVGHDVLTGLRRGRTRFRNKNVFVLHFLDFVRDREGSVTQRRLHLLFFSFDVEVGDCNYRWRFLVKI